MTNLHTIITCYIYPSLRIATSNFYLLIYCFLSIHRPPPLNCWKNRGKTRS